MLLHGRILAQARRALADLSARTLRLRPGELDDVSLADGIAGVALAHAALDPVFPGAGHAGRARRLLDRAIERLGTQAQVPGLHLGLAGLGWVVQHMVDRDQSRELLAPIDRALTCAVAAPGWSERFDVIHGIAGVGVYALARLPDPAASTLVDAVVMRLADTARRRDRGVAWWSDPAWLSCRAPRPAHGTWNLGVAHGAGGAIALLGHIAAADVARSTRDAASALLERAVDCLLAQELPASNAWCGGDLGIAAALLAAGRSAGQPAWRRAAIRLGLRAAGRPADDRVVDAGLCHGAAGAAHLFHRLHRDTGDDRFAAAAREWFARALAMRRPRAGFAGFRSLEPDRHHRLAWRSAPGFLTGGAGIALALVAATTDADPAWDRTLLLS